MEGWVRDEWIIHVGWWMWDLTFSVNDLRNTLTASVIVFCFLTALPKYGSATSLRPVIGFGKGFGHAVVSNQVSGTTSKLELLRNYQSEVCSRRKCVTKMPTCRSIFTPGWVVGESPYRGVTAWPTGHIRPIHLNYQESEIVTFI